MAYKTLVEKRDLYDKFGEKSEVKHETPKIFMTEDVEISDDDAGECCGRTLLQIRSELSVQMQSNHTK